MKKIGLLVATFTMIMLFAFSANALESTGQCGENVYWSFNENTGELVISGDGAIYDYLGDNSPFYKSDIRSIIFEDGITKIGDYAFYDCNSLNSIDIGDDIENIGECAFCGCIRLLDVTIPNSVTSIETAAFSSCESLTEINIPNSIKSISDDTFRACENLSSVTIANSVTNIGTCAFIDCFSLKNITIPNSVTIIKDAAFYNCYNLENVTISNSVIDIKDYAFAYCENLSDVYYNGTEQQWNKIGIGSYNETLTSANIHFHIHNYNEITIEPTCTTQGYTTYTCECGDSYVADYTDAAHSYVDSVCSVCGDIEVIASGTCGENVTWVLNGVGTLSITGMGNMMNYSYSMAPWYNYYVFIKKVVIYDGVTSIGDNAFSGCTGLQEIIISGSVTIIGDNAFDWCTSLQKSTISYGVTSIGDNAFSYCTSLQEVIIPDSVTTIGDDAFCGCGLQEITIPEGVVSIGRAAFAYSIDLRKITIPASVTSIGDFAFYDCISLVNIMVDEDNAYYSSTEDGILLNKQKTYLIQYPVGKSRTECVILEGVTSIGDSAFESCRSLQEITIPDSITSIGEFTFASCDSLKDVYFCGIEEQWNKIDIGMANDYLINATKHFESCNLNYGLKHIYTSVITNPATHLAEGKETFFCDCGYNYIKSIIKTTEHTYEAVITAPTCTEQGYTTYTCECGDSYVADYVKENGHSHEAVVTTPATHLTEGVMTYSCACGDTYTEAIDKLPGHTYNTVVTAPTCTRQGYTTYTCECGDSYVDDFKEIVDHKDNDGDEFCDYCDEFLGVEEEENKCSHICHKSGFMGFIWKIINFFQKLFGINPVCECGMAHY